jgi:hypothetical protein
MSRRTALVMLTVSQKQQIQKQTGKNPEQMTEDELNNAMEKTGIEPQVSSDSDIDQIEKLAELKDKGVLTQEEFDAKKSQILKM